MMPVENAQWRDISLGVDLFHATPRYLAFLARCRHNEEIFTNKESLRIVLHRYEHFWLPLLAEWQQTDLEPPSDVHWMWHLHMLQPGGYSQYSKERFSRVLPHKIRFNESEDRQATERTRQIWRDNFPSEPYDIDTSTKDGRSLGSTQLADLLDVATDQWNFLYQVALPHYRDTTFVFRAVDRYKQLLLLKTRKQRAALKLPIDVILVWRVHALHPIQYLNEIQRILGPFAVDTLGESPQDIHHVLLMDSNDLWRTFYQEPLFLPGTMFRGFDHKSSISELPKKLYAIELIDSCTLTIDDLIVSDLRSKAKRLTVEARRLGVSSFSFDRIFKTKLEAGKAASSNQSTGLGTCSFDKKIHRGIQFMFYSKKGTLCLSHEQDIASIDYNPHQAFSNQSFMTSSKSITIPKVSVTDPNLSFTMKVKANSPSPHVLSLERDPYTPGRLPMELKSFVDTLPDWKDATSLENNGEPFTVARHRLKSKRGMLLFGVHMVRHEEEQLNSVLLYHNNSQLVCAAHSIGREQLPAPEQVQETQKVVYDVETGDQAMLIRNHLGDWAVVIAQYTSISGTPGDGQVDLKIHFLQTNTTAYYSVKEGELHSIQCGYVTIDMPSGRLTIDAACDELSENITLAFSVGMLLVTCLHRSTSLPFQTPTGSVRSVKSLASSTDLLANGSTMGNGTAKSYSSRQSAKSHMNRKKMTKRRKMSASFTFFLACGLRIDVTLHGSANTSRASSRTSSYSGRKHGGHVDVTTIDFGHAPTQQQISDRVQEMIVGDSGRYTDGTRDYYTGKPTEQEKYMDIHL